MTISTITARVVYPGDGQSTNFSIPFVFFDSDELLVIERDTAGLEIVKQLGVDYSVKGGNGDVGSIQSFSAPPIGVQWVIKRNTRPSQLVDYTPNDPFPADTHERALDRLQAQIQEAADDLSRAPKLPISAPLIQLHLPEPSPAQLLRWNAAGDGLENADILSNGQGNISVPVSIAQGGTGCKDAVAALAALNGFSKSGGIISGPVDIVGPLSAQNGLSINGNFSLNGNISATTINNGAPSGLRNRIFNGNFAINQRQITSVADGGYCFDRWYVLTETGNVGVSQITQGIDTNALFGIRLTQPDAIGKRIGLAQIIECRNCFDLQNQIIHAAARIRTTYSGAIRYAILGWTGTQDTVTRDIVANWNATNFSAGGFFLATNITIIHANTFVPGAGISASLIQPSNTIFAGSFSNLILFIWTESALPAQGTLDIWNVQLDQGALITPFEARPFSVELSLCQRYYEKSYDLPIAPGTITDTGQSAYVANASGAGAMSIPFCSLKRTSPTITIYNPVIGTSGTWRNSSDANVTLTTNPAVLGTNLPGTRGFSLGGVTANSSATIRGHWVADAEL